MGHPPGAGIYAHGLTAGNILETVNYIAIITEYYNLSHETIIPMRNNLFMY